MKTKQSKRITLSLTAIIMTVALLFFVTACNANSGVTADTVTPEERAFLDAYYNADSIAWLQLKGDGDADFYKMLLDKADDFDLFWNALAYADANYYKDLDYDAIDKIIAATMIDSLDNYSQMSDNSLLISNAIVQVGVGITVSSNINSYHTVEFVHPSSGADGIFERGDVLYSVTNESAEVTNQSLLGLPTSYLAAAIAGGEGTELSFVVLRQGVETELTVIKKQYTARQCYYVDNIGGDVSDDIGYIRLTSFAHNADTHFITCVEQFLEDDNKALILDLRNNGGGTTGILSRIAGYLITDGENKEVPIIEFNSTVDGAAIVFKSYNSDKYLSMPIYVLVNANTASASEALVSAMSYYETGVLIGTVTYGKGVGQNINDKALTDGDGVTYSVSLTTGEYYVYVDKTEDNPDGKICIDGVGITPDYELDAADVNKFYYDRSEDVAILKANELFAALTAPTSDGE